MGARSRASSRRSSSASTPPQNTPSTLRLQLEIDEVAVLDRDPMRRDRAPFEEGKDAHKFFSLILVRPFYRVPQRIDITYHELGVVLRVAPSTQRLKCGHRDADDAIRII